jgi:hypothetical protein
MPRCQGEYWSNEHARTEGVPMKPNTATMTHGPSATHRPPRVQETPRYPVHVRSTFVRLSRRPEIGGSGPAVQQDRG